MKKPVVMGLCMLWTVLSICAQANEYDTAGFEHPPWDSPMASAINLEMKDPALTILSSSANRVTFRSLDPIGEGYYPRRAVVYSYFYENNKQKKVEYVYACSEQEFSAKFVWATNTYYGIYGNPEIVQDTRNEFECLWNNGCIRFYVKKNESVPHIVCFTFRHPDLTDEIDQRISEGFDDQGLAVAAYGDLKKAFENSGYIVNDLSKSVGVYASQGMMKLTMEMVTLKPGERYEVFSSGPNISVCVLELGSPSSGTFFYTAVNGYGTYTDPNNTDLKYYTAGLTGRYNEEASCLEFPLSSLEKRDWLNKIYMDVGYNQKVAVSYFRDGRWREEVYTGDFTVYPDTDEFYFFLYDGGGTGYWFYKSRTQNTDSFNQVLKGNKAASDVVYPYYLVGGSVKELIFSGSGFRFENMEE